MKQNWPLLAFVVLAAGCHTDMWVQPKARVQGESTFFENRMDSRPRVPGAVARGASGLDDEFTTGRRGREFVKDIPADAAQRALGLESYRQLILRGKDQFTAYCSHCHGAVGDGKGMIASRGLQLRRPVATYHTDRLRKMDSGYFFDVITHGYGVMYPQNRIPVADRWAIVSYVRTLQRSQAPSGVMTKTKPAAEQIQANHGGQL